MISFALIVQIPIYASIVDDQLKMILNIALLNKNGYKISKIAEMDQEQIKDIILHLTDISDAHDSLLDSLITCHGRF